MTEDTASGAIRNTRRSGKESPQSLPCRAHPQRLQLGPSPAARTAERHSRPGPIRSASVPSAGQNSIPAGSAPTSIPASILSAPSLCRSASPTKALAMRAVSFRCMSRWSARQRRGLRALSTPGARLTTSSRRSSHPTPPAQRCSARFHCYFERSGIGLRARERPVKHTACFDRFCRGNPMWLPFFRADTEVCPYINALIHA